MKKIVTAAVSAVMAFGAFAAGELPAGYSAVDAIVAPRGAYIDTGYKPNQSSRTMMDVTVQGTSEYWFSVSGADYTTDAYALCNDYDLGIYYAVDDNGGSFKSDKTADGCVPNGRHTVGITPYSMLIDGEVWATKESKGSFQLVNDLYLFASNASSTRENGTSYARATQTSIICHGCTISEGETLKRNFVPCVRTADAVAGLYDTVDGVFYENAGTGAFSTPLPFARELTSGTYEITESFTFVAPKMESALKIAEGATVTLNIAAGVAVSLRGGDAFEVWGAGAGIEVPASATLKVTGAGKVFAYGGKGANGCNGLNGGNGSANGSNGNFTSGSGGAGGWGGGGAGAGIGGKGGNGGGGGNGGKSVSATDWSYTDISGNAGDNGGAGKSGGTCGIVSIEGTMKIFAYGGVAAVADGAGGANGDWAWEEGSTYYFGAWGGGGGGGGAKGGAAADIGGGGAGGYGGGGGGSGAYLSRYYWDTFRDMPGWGAGGSGAANGASGGASSRDGEDVHGGAGGAKGAAGARGGNGALTVTDRAVAYAVEGRYSVGRLSETVEIFYDNEKLLSVSGGTSSELSYSVVNNDTATLGDGWYVAKGTVSRGKIDVEGTANLVLLHGASLTVTGEGDAAISVPDGNTLNIFGVESGSLTATNDDYAGIGVTENSVCVIYGGTVTATGGMFGAGIGGGYDGDGGTVTINDGAVTAKGGDYAAGIGGGMYGDGGTVTINGGTVTATGGEYGAGIGGGYYDDGGTVTVNGGTVTATGGLKAAGIGGGCRGDGATVTVNGGTVTAAGGAEAWANIGWGTYGGKRIWEGELTYGAGIGIVEGAIYDSPYVKIASKQSVVPVTPGVPLVFDTAAEATNAAKNAKLTPSAPVAAMFGGDTAAIGAYCKMFEFGVTPTADGKWAVEAFLTPKDWSNVVESARAATRQIPLAELASREFGDPLVNVSLANCVPGFYYSLYDGAAVTNLKANVNEDDCNILCGPGTTVVIPVVPQPSSTSGFFSIGVLDAPAVIPGETRQAQPPARQY